MKPIPNVKKIAVLHGKALGDFIVILPALQAIRETYPEAEIVLLAKQWHKDFLARRSSPINRVMVMPVEIKEEFDIAIHFQGDGKESNPIINKIGSSVTAGMRNPGAEPIHRSIPYIHYQSEVMRNLEIARLIGAYTNQLEPVIELTESDLKEAQSVLKEYSNIIVLHPGADDLRRRWPAEKFAQLGDALANVGNTIVITGAEREQEVVANVINQMKTAPVNTCGQLSLGGLAGVLAKATIVISNDTGPLHLARAVGAKTVGIFWWPNVLNWGPLTREKHRVVFSTELHCPQCGIIPAFPWPFEPITKDCDHLFCFVKDITVDSVLDEVTNLIGA